MYRILVLCHPPLLTEPPPSGFALPVLLWIPITGPLSLCHFSEDPWPGACHLQMCATNRYEQPPAWGQTKNDRSALPALGKSGLVCLAVPCWAKLVPRAQKAAPGSCSSAGIRQRAGGLGFPCPTLPQGHNLLCLSALTLPPPSGWL